MQNEIIETYLTAAKIKGHEAAKIREVACKVAAIASGAKCDGSLMTDPQRWTESSLLLRCRI